MLVGISHPHTEEQIMKSLIFCLLPFLLNSQIYGRGNTSYVDTAKQRKLDDKTETAEFLIADSLKQFSTFKLTRSLGSLPNHVFSLLIAGVLIGPTLALDTVSFVTNTALVEPVLVGHFLVRQSYAKRARGKDRKKVQVAYGDFIQSLKASSSLAELYDLEEKYPSKEQKTLRAIGLMALDSFNKVHDEGLWINGRVYGMEDFKYLPEALYEDFYPNMIEAKEKIGLLDQELQDDKEKFLEALLKKESWNGFSAPIERATYCVNKVIEEGS
jgi:hypothetical protein